MIEPSRPDRHVDFRRIPDERLRFFNHLAAAQVLSSHVAHGSCQHLLLRVLRNGLLVEIVLGDDAPFRLTPASRLCSYPAYVRPHDGNHRIGLQPADEAVPAHEVVLLFLSVRPFAAGSVEPYLAHFSVLCEQFGQLADEVIVVGLCAVEF